MMSIVMHTSIDRSVVDVVALAPRPHTRPPAEYMLSRRQVTPTIDQAMGEVQRIIQQPSEPWPTGQPTFVRKPQLDISAAGGLGPTHAPAASDGNSSHPSTAGPPRTTVQVPT